MLPSVDDEASFDALVDDPDRVAPIVSFLSAHFGLPDLVRPTRGSAIVVMNDDEVIKLMAPHDAALAEAEAVSLQALDGRLPVPTAQYLDHGRLDDWAFVRMTRLRGEELTELWPSLTRDDHLRMAQQLGDAVAHLHESQAPAIIPRIDWPTWVEQRRATIVDVQRTRGCPEELLAQLPDFLDAASLDAGPTGWLHTEIMREHLLAEQVDGEWRLTGLFDFEPSWVGPRDYELSAVGLFFAGGDPELLRTVQANAGLEASPQRVMAMALMHRYLNLAWYHRRLGGPLDLTQLAKQWFA